MALNIWLYVDFISDDMLISKIALQRRAMVVMIVK